MFEKILQVFFGGFIHLNKYVNKKNETKTKVVRKIIQNMCNLPTVERVFIL